MDFKKGDFIRKTDEENIWYVFRTDNAWVHCKTLSKEPMFNSFTFSCQKEYEKLSPEEYSIYLLNK